MAQELKTYDLPVDHGDFTSTVELFYLKSEVDKVISDLEESHKREVGQLLMEISKLKKLVETADKLVKSKGGFTVQDIKFKGIKLEGFEKKGEHDA